MNLVVWMLAMHSSILLPRGERLEPPDAMMVRSEKKVMLQEAQNNDLQSSQALRDEI